MDFGKMYGAEFVRFKKAEFIIHAGEKSNYFYIIVSGNAHRIKSGINGEETIMRNYKKGDILCALITYSDIIAASNIIADTTLCCWKIPRQTFIKEMEHEPQLMKLLLDEIAKQSIEISMKYRTKQEGTTPNSLCKFLKDHARTLEDGTLCVNKNYTNKNIAGHLGVHKVTATRIINQLQHERIVRRTKEGLIIDDLEQLELYINQNKKMKY